MIPNIGSNKNYPQVHLFFPTQTSTPIPPSEITLRYIYENTEFLPHEISSIQNFRTYAAEKLPASSELANTFSSLPDSAVLRYFYAGQDKTSKGLDLFKDHQKVIARRGEVGSYFSERHREFLDSGVIYCYGRDAFMRPIVVLNMRAQIDLVKKSSIEFYKEVLHWFYSYIKENLLLDGQVENWVSIVNTKDTGFWDSLKMKDIIGAQTEVDPTNATRPYRMYMYDPPSMMKTMLPKDSDVRKKHKFHFMTKEECGELWTHINPGQIEQRFGGNAEDLTAGFWPPTCPTTDFLLDSGDPQEKFITKRQYLEKFNNGALAGYQVNEKILEEARLEEVEIEVGLETNDLPQSSMSPEEPDQSELMKAEFYKSRVEAGFGPTPYGQSGIQKKDLEDDGYEIIFGENNERLASQKARPSINFVQTMIQTQNDKPDLPQIIEVPEEDKIKIDVYEGIMENGVKTGRVKINFTERNLNFVQAVLCDHDVKQGMVEINIVELFLDNSLNPENKAVLTVDIQGEYLAIRGLKSGAQLHKIMWEDFIGVELPAKKLILHTTTFKRPGCCGGFKGTDFRVLKSVTLWTKLPVNEPRTFDAAKSNQKPKFTGQVKDIVLDMFTEWQSRVNDIDAPRVDPTFPVENWKKLCLVVINPVAGDGKSKQIYLDNKHLLEANGFSITLLESNGKDHQVEAFRDMSQRQLNSYYMVIWCGGDGTGHQIMNGFGQRETCDVDSIRLATLGGGGGCSFLLNQSLESNLARKVTDINTVWCITRAKFKQINLFAYNMDNLQTIYSWHMITFGYWADIGKARLESRSSGFAEYGRLMKYYLDNPNSITGTIWAINNKDDHVGEWDDPIDPKFKICDQEKIYMFWLAKWPYFVTEFLEQAKTTIGEESGYSYLNKAEYSQGKWKGRGQERLAEYCKSMRNGDMAKKDASELSELWEIRIELDKPENVMIDGEIYTTQKVQGSSSGIMGVWVLC